MLLEDTDFVGEYVEFTEDTVINTMSKIRVKLSKVILQKIKLTKNYII